MLSIRATISGYVCPKCALSFRRMRDGLQHLRHCMRQPVEATRQQVIHGSASQSNTDDTLMEVSPERTEREDADRHRKALAVDFCTLLDVYRVPESAVELIQRCMLACVDRALQTAEVQSDQLIELARQQAVPATFRSVRRTKTYLDRIAADMVWALVRLIVTKIQGMKVIEENIGTDEKPAFIYRISLVTLVQQIVESDPSILQELREARDLYEQNLCAGVCTGVRGGTIYKRNSLFVDEETRDRTLALLFHSDEVDTAKNQLGSRSGRNTLVGSVAIANASSTRLTSPSDVHTFLIASKDVYQNLSRNVVFDSIIDEIKQLREGMDASIFVV